MKSLVEQDFKKNVIEATQLVVVDFWAEWCGPCVALAPVLEQIEKEYPEVIFYKADIEKNANIAGALGIRAIPYIAFFKNGEKVSELIGGQSKQNITNSIKSFL